MTSGGVRAAAAAICETAPVTERAPDGDLTTFDLDPFTFEDDTKDVYRKGTGPAVIVITEMPGISPMVLGFADRLVALGCSVVLPDLYGEAGREPFRGKTLPNAVYSIGNILKGCISRDFATFALGKTSPVVTWLRGLAQAEHARCGGPGVGAVGMCFSGGFALAMATDPSVVAPVMSQPSLPLAIGKRGSAVDISDADLDVVAQRCSAQGLRVLGLRFNGDAMSPAGRFSFLSDRLGDGFIAVELDQNDGHPDALDSPLASAHHSVLTTSLVDEPGAPTRLALDAVLDLFRDKLDL